MVQSQTELASKSIASSVDLTIKVLFQVASFPPLSRREHPRIVLVWAAITLYKSVENPSYVVQQKSICRVSMRPWVHIPSAHEKIWL